MTAPPVIPIKPQFDVNYFIGWTGFSRSADAIGDAIAYGERFEQLGFPSVNHAFTVVGDNSIVEAQLKDGVVRTELTTRTLDPIQKVYLRPPLFWTPELGQAIAISALKTVGGAYDDLLIAEDALADTLAGHLINEAFNDWPHEFMDKLIAEKTRGEFICSYDVAFALAAQPVFKGFPLFTGRPLAAIDPMLLMVDGPYEPVIYLCESGS